MGSWNTYISSETQSHSRKLKLEQPRLFSSRRGRCLAIIAAVPFNGAAWAVTVFKQKLNGLIQLLHITGQDHGPEDEAHGQYVLGKWQVTSWRSCEKIQDDTRFPSDLTISGFKDDSKQMSETFWRFREFRKGAITTVPTGKSSYFLSPFASAWKGNYTRHL